MTVLRNPIQLVVRNPLRGVLGSQPSNTSDTGSGMSGSFSSAFSAAFDLNTSRYQFSSAFSSAFAIFSRRKEFSSAFSDAFTNDNI